MQPTPARPVAPALASPTSTERPPVVAKPVAQAPVAEAKPAVMPKPVMSAPVIGPAPTATAVETAAVP
ncbi:MAG: poly(3-hydroxyalkanoate) granule-associated protein PhaF, partial [Pseudomonadota bacterium]